MGKGRKERAVRRMTGLALERREKAVSQDVRTTERVQTPSA